MQIREKLYNDIIEIFDIAQSSKLTESNLKRIKQISQQMKNIYHDPYHYFISRVITNPETENNIVEPTKNQVNKPSQIDKISDNVNGKKPTSMSDIIIDENRNTVKEELNTAQFNSNSKEQLTDDFLISLKDTKNIKNIKMPQIYIVKNRHGVAKMRIGRINYYKTIHYDNNCDLIIKSLESYESVYENLNLTLNVITNVRDFFEKYLAEFTNQIENESQRNSDNDVEMQSNRSQAKSENESDYDYRRNRRNIVSSSQKYSIFNKPKTSFSKYLFNTNFMSDLLEKDSIQDISMPQMFKKGHNWEFRFQSNKRDFQRDAAYENILQQQFDVLIRKNIETLGIDNMDQNEFVLKVVNKFNLTQGEEIFEERYFKVDDDQLNILREKDLNSFKIVQYPAHQPTKGSSFSVDIVKKDTDEKHQKSQEYNDCRVLAHSKIKFMDDFYRSAIEKGFIKASIKTFDDVILYLKSKQDQ